MFEILNGREHFFQWDLEQKIIVNDATINEVHFSNKTDECSLVCVVEEYEGKRVANVPNILLQTDWAIHVYAYCANYTKVEEVFKVIPRSKPADYVYTETEVKTWDELEQKIEQALSDARFEEAINKYLKENPIEAGATEEQIAQIEANRKAIEAAATKEYVNNAIAAAQPDLSGYALKTEIPDVSNFITMADVEGKGYTTMATVEAKGYTTSAQVSTLISEALSNIGVAEGGAY